ncbi:mucin-5AC-like [Echeneis naucrates]|nr:mucin-5AC-like [Echeneis naucrates]
MTANTSTSITTTAAPNMTANTSTSITTTAAPNMTANTSTSITTTVGAGSTTNQSTATTAVVTTEAPAPVVVIAATFVEPFSSDLVDRNTSAFQELERRVVGFFDPIYARRFGQIFVRTFVILFRRAATRFRADNTEAEVGIEFNQTTAASGIPEPASVRQTLVEAVNNPNITSEFNLTVEADSIRTIEQNTSTTAAPNMTANTSTSITTTAAPNMTANTSTSITTTAAPNMTANTSTSITTTVGAGSTTNQSTATTAVVTTEAPAPVVVIAATLVEPFSSDLEDRNTSAFQALERRVVGFCDPIYARRFGQIFVRTFVVIFRRATARFRADNTEAEVGIEFNRTTAASGIPDSASVAQTLVDAVNNPNITNEFNLTVQADSIRVVGENTTNTTTAVPNMNTTAAATTITTTAEPVTIRRIVFRSVGETFTSDLANPSSAAFANRAFLIKSTLEPFYQRAFSSFRSLNVVSFSNGSIINNMDAVFASSFVPSITQIANVLIEAASQISDFNIDPSSISVDGAQVSGGVSHKSVSLLTAFCLVLLSWLLKIQQ